jgi:hypothetical protein
LTGVYRRIALLHLRPGLDAPAVSRLERELGEATRLPGLMHAHLGRHLEGTVGGGDFTWDLVFETRAACPPWAEQLATTGTTTLVSEATARVDVVQFAPSLGRIGDPEVRDGIKRTLLLEVRRDTDSEAAARFDRSLTAMPLYIPAIRNWSYSRVDDEGTVGPRRWTHVWEQEFSELSGLKVDYMMSPYHWGYVDGWFDAESPHHVVAPGVAHVYTRAQTSLLALVADHLDPRPHRDP